MQLKISCLLLSIQEIAKDIRFKLEWLSCISVAVEKKYYLAFNQFESDLYKSPCTATPTVPDSIKDCCLYGLIKCTVTKGAAINFHV